MSHMCIFVAGCRICCYYLCSRAAESDPDKIIDVFVDDRLKESLSPSIMCCH